MQKAYITVDNIPLTESGQLDFKVIGCEDQEIDNQYISDIYSEVCKRHNYVIVSGPSRVENTNRWIVYLACNLNKGVIIFDVQEVNKVEIAQGLAQEWPIRLAHNALALDVSFSDDGKNVYINKIIKNTVSEE